MASPIEAQMILCDAAQADQSGKLHMLGAGWHMTGSPTAPQAVAVMIKVPWDRTNQKIPITLRLLDSDGKAVCLPTPNGSSALEIKTLVEVGRPAGIAHGSYIPAAFAVNVGSMPLTPGRYVWHLTAGETERQEPFQVFGLPGTSPQHHGT